MRERENDMTEEELRELIDRLDQEIPCDGAVVEWHRNDQSEVEVTANERGYVRLGIEFLKAAFAELHSCHPGVPEYLEVDMRYMMSGDTSLWPSWFELEEGTSVSGPGSEDRTSPLGPLVGMLTVVLILIAALVVVLCKAGVLG